MAFPGSLFGQLNRWRADNLYELMCNGTPDDIARDNRRFWFVVLEGNDQIQGAWTVEWISDEQAEKLLKMLTGFLGEEASSWVMVIELRKKLNLEIFPEYGTEKSCDGT